MSDIVKAISLCEEYSKEFNDRYCVVKCQSGENGYFVYKHSFVVENLDDFYGKVVHHSKKRVNKSLKEILSRKVFEKTNRKVIHKTRLFNLFN